MFRSDSVPVSNAALSAAYLLACGGHGQFQMNPYGFPIGSCPALPPVQRQTLARSVDRESGGTRRTARTVLDSVPVGFGGTGSSADPSALRLAIEVEATTMSDAAERNWPLGSCSGLEPTMQSKPRRVRSGRSRPGWRGGLRDSLAFRAPHPLRDSQLLFGEVSAPGLVVDSAPQELRLVALRLGLDYPPVSSAKPSWSSPM